MTSGFTKIVVHSDPGGAGHNHVDIFYVDAKRTVFRAFLGRWIGDSVRHLPRVSRNRLFQVAKTKHYTSLGLDRWYWGRDSKHRRIRVLNRIVIGRWE